MSFGVVGRDTEKQWLASEIEMVAGGRRRTVVIRGEPGIGKTALLGFVVEQLQSLDFTVCVTSAQEIERHRPFVVVRRALGVDGASGSVLTPLMDLDQSVGEPDAQSLGLVDLPEVEFRWIDAIHDIVDTMLTSRPIALVIDDVQWADDASIHLLQALHDRLHDRPLLILLATRPTLRNDALGRLLSTVRADDLVDLGPLEVEDVTALMIETLGHQPTSHELARIQRASGNPLFIKTLLAANDSASGDNDDLPNSVRRLVVHTVHELGDDARRVLDLVSVIGKPASLRTLAQHLDRPLADVIGTTERVLASTLLVDVSDGVAFRHDLVREVIYDEIHPSVRAALHLAVGTRMLEHGGSVGEAASHFLRGAQPGDTEAVAVLRSAALQIGRISPTAASQLLERAVEILPTDHPDREELIVHLVRSSVFSDRLDTGLELLESALDAGVHPNLESELRNARTQIFFLSGEPRRGAADFDQLAVLARGTGREPVIFADAAVSAMFAVDLDQARSLANRSLAVAERSVEPSAESLAYGVLAWITAMSGDLDGGLALANRAVEVADAADGLEGHRRVPYLFQAQCLLWCDRAADAAASLRRGRRLSKDLGMGWDEPMYHALAADEHMRSGAWDDALAEIDAGLGRSDEVGAHFSDSWLYVHRARVMFGRGEFEQSNHALDQAMDGLAGRGGQGVDQVWWIRGLLTSLENPTEGLRFLMVLWNRLDELGVRLRQFELAPDIVTVALRASRREVAESIVDRVTMLSADHPSALAEAATAHCRVVFDPDSEAFIGVAEQYERRCLPVEALRVRAEAVATLSSTVRSGRNEAEAVVMNQMSELEADGLRVWHLGASSGAADHRPSSGWGSLTRSERVVIDLVGQGRSNAEIAEALSISRRTVESHLYHAYPKLELSSRVELALEAARRIGPETTERRRAEQPS